MSKALGLFERLDAVTTKLPVTPVTEDIALRLINIQKNLARVAVLDYAIGLPDEELARLGCTKETPIGDLVDRVAKDLKSRA